MIFMLLGNMKRVFFLVFLHVVRHPAESDGRPTAGAHEFKNRRLVFGQSEKKWKCQKRLALLCSC